MKVQELVEKYAKNNRIDIAKEVETQPYVGIAAKRNLANLILDNCTTLVDEEVHIDSVERYLLFTIAVIAIHTNLEFTDETDENYSAIDDYDLLCQSGLLVKVIETFKDDYASCQEILNMTTADRMQNNMTIDKKLYALVDALQDTISGVIKGMAQNLNLDNLATGLPVDAQSITQILELIQPK